MVAYHSPSPPTELNRIYFKLWKILRIFGYIRRGCFRIYNLLQRIKVVNLFYKLVMCEIIECMFWHWGKCTGDPEAVADYGKCRDKNGTCV